MPPDPPRVRPRLRRNLGGWQVLALSVALMAPSLAANINPQLAVADAGRAVPLAFVIATVGVLLVSYSFVRLTQHFNTSGSVYGFVGATLGARAGAVAGWSLIGTYTFLGVTSALTAGIFASSLFSSLAGWNHPSGWTPYLVGAAVLGLAGPLAAIPIKRATRILLVCEATTVALIVIVTTVIFVRLATAGAGGPAGSPRLTFDVFRPPSGAGPSAIALGAVFGFLSFVGFEASAALGDEARTPRRDIPRAIFGTVVAGGVFYVAVSAVEVMGFGTTAPDLARFGSTPSLLGHLAQSYLTAWVGDLITLGTIISAISAAAASAVGGSRLLFALSRDSVGPGAALARISPRRGTPVVSVSAIVVATFGIEAVLYFACHAAPLDGLGWTATIATLIILVVYLSSTVGTIRLLFFSGTLSVPAGEAVVPAAGILVLGYTLFRNVVPWPTGPQSWLPAISAAWIAIGIAAVVAAPGLARRIGARLTADEGLRPSGSRPA